MTNSDGLTVFIPVFNEQSLLAPNTRRLLEFLEPLRIPYEIIIGSNGSTDRTVKIGMRLCNQHNHIHFFHLPEKGVGNAFRLGVKKAKYERIVTVDMDLSINLEFISVAQELLDRYDMVIGSKITGSQKRSFIRKFASNSFIHLARVLLRIHFHDYSIAAKGYRKGLVIRYLPHIDDKTFYVVEIVWRAFHDGKKLKEIPVQCHDMRESRFNLMYEGVYKFSNLFRLWLSSFKISRKRD